MLIVKIHIARVLLRLKQAMPLMVVGCYLKRLPNHIFTERSPTTALATAFPVSSYFPSPRRALRQSTSASRNKRLATACSGMKTLVSFGEEYVHAVSCSWSHSFEHKFLADVDGTLIRTVGDNANKLHKLAFINAWKEVYGLDTHLDVIQHHGNTDPLILIRVAEYHGIAKSDVSLSCAALLQYCHRHKLLFSLKDSLAGCCQAQGYGGLDAEVLHGKC